MIILNKELLKNLAETINAPERITARQEEQDRFFMYEGHTRAIIEKAIKKEFSKPETVDELTSRLIPINISQKIIQKLSQVYNEAPVREAYDENEDDQNLLEIYEDELELNQRMKEFNRHFKLFKRGLMEIFIDEEGMPGLRSFPRHTYEVFSIDQTRKNVPNVICIIKKWSQMYEEQVISVWTKDQHVLIDGVGNVLTDKMAKMNNEEGINPYGVLPFIYINASTYSVDPIPDDDLLRTSIAIPVVLTDLLFAVKYQSWSMLVAIGNVGDIPANPSSIIHLQYDAQGNKPDIKTVKPEIDINAILQLIANLVSLLLTTKNLSAKTISTTQSVQDTLSGISKTLDSAESVEDQRDQQAYFYRAENDLWQKLSKHMIPYWRESNLLNEKLNREFSESFDVSVRLKEPEVKLSEKQQTENAILRIKNNLSTIKRELRNLNPDMNDDEIEILYESITEEAREFLRVQSDDLVGDNGEIQSEV